MSDAAVSSTRSFKEVPAEKCGSVTFRVSGVGMLNILEEVREDEMPSEIWLELDEAIALRDYLNKVLP